MPKASPRKKKVDFLSPLFDLPEATIQNVVLAQQPLEVMPANRSLYTTIPVSRKASVGMGYLKAIGAVLCGLVDRIETNAQGTIGRAHLHSSTTSGVIYRMSWDIRSPALLRFGGFPQGLPSYQVAVLQFIACSMDPYNKRAYHWSEEVVERWMELLMSLEVVHASATNAPYWDASQLWDICSQVPDGLVEGLADALYFCLRYQLPKSGEAAKRVIHIDEDDVVPLNEPLGRGEAGTFLLAGHGARISVVPPRVPTRGTLAPALVHCPVCHSETPTNDPYCANCGAYLDPTRPSAGTPQPNTSSGSTIATNVTFQTRFTSMQHVAKGGMGTFHKVYDSVLERWVGAKALLLDGLDAQRTTEATEGFKQEARFMSDLNHPTIPVVYAFGEIGGQLHLLMEYIDGITLEDYLLQTGIPIDSHPPAVNLRCLPLREVLEIGFTLCTFLDYLHTPLTSKGTIIYRDLKPSNVLITIPEHFLFVIDFGIARSFKPGQQKDTTPLGSWGYSPPEQFGTRQTDERSDLYSLGALLHFLISGRDPSESPFVFDTFSALQLPTKPPAELEKLVFWLVENDMKKRPTSAKQVQKEIQSIQRLLGYI